MAAFISSALTSIPHGVIDGALRRYPSRLVWRSKRKLDAAGQLIAMDTFGSELGIRRVRPATFFAITAVYDNPTGAPIDAMAGLFISYSRN